MKRTTALYGLLGLLTLLHARPLGGQDCSDATAEGRQSSVSESALSGLVSAVRSYVAEGQIVGAELLVKQGDRVLLDRGFGWKDRERQEPMEPGTVFNIRSMTKTMVGLVAQMLVDEGRLSLDDRVAEFLPGFDHDGADEITIDQLLTHRAGLPLSIVKSADEYSSLRDMGNAVGEAGPQFEPGSKFFYSDAGADALGAVVEEVEGRPLQEVLRERLIEPLGLTSTFAGSAEDDPRWSRVAPLYARVGGTWTKVWDPAKGAFYPFVWGSQGMMSTPADYARIVDLLDHDGRRGDARLISRRAVESAEEPLSRTTFLGSDAPEPTNFAGMQARYGRFLQVWTPWPAERTSDRAIGHSGSDGTIVYAWPARNLVIAYFTQSRGTTTHLRLERVVDRLILHPGVAESVVSPSEAQGLLGSYKADFGRFAGSELDVIVQDGQLALTLPGGVISELRPAEADGWRQVVLAPSVAVAFDRGEDGVTQSMRWRDPSGEHVLPRVTVAAKEAEASAEQRTDLQGYLGRYRLVEDPGQPDVELVRVGDALAVVLPGAPAPLPFREPDADGFWVLVANPQMRIRFKKDVDGRVVSFAVVAPDGGTSVRVKVSHNGRGEGDPRPSR